jgi:DNA invertase Pin-like site-specific DNA recombinase
LGTRKDNAQDKVSKGRHLIGERSPNAKLTASQVHEILNSKSPQRAVAAQFGISQTQVSRIKNAQRWAQESRG